MSEFYIDKKLVSELAKGFQISNFEAAKLILDFERNEKLDSINTTLKNGFNGGQLETIAGALGGNSTLVVDVLSQIRGLLEDRLES